MVRKLVLTLLISQALLATAQQPAPQPPAGSNWRNVQILPVDTPIDVRFFNEKAKRQRTVCKLQSVGTASLTCLTGFGEGKTMQRTAIESIRLRRRVRSALIGTAPGAAIMAGSGIALATEKCQGQFLCGLGAGVTLILGGFVVQAGAITGAVTDFAGSTIYTAP